MKFFKNRKESSSSVLSNEKTEELTLKVCFDYYSTYGKAGKTIINGQKYVMNKFKDLSGLTNQELDVHLNKELIKEKAIKKYNTDYLHLDLNDADWFPRLRTIKFSKDEDLESVSSSISDLSPDGFSGPFSWETKSLQEMVFPATPEAERKNAAGNGKKKKSKKKKNASVSEDENNTNDHRSYETLEDLRERLIKNYNEAKQQREKYLNLKGEKTKEEVEERSVNGYRHKQAKQNVYKNYQIKTEGDMNENSSKEVSRNSINASPIKRKGSRTRALSSTQSPLSLNNSDSFSAELSSAVFKHSSSGSSLVTSTPQSTSSYSVKSDLEIQYENDANIAANKETSTVNGKVNNVASPTEFTRNNSTRRSKRSGSRSGSIRRKNSQKKSSSPEQNSPTESLSNTVETNDNDGDDATLSKQNGEPSSPGLGNIMDMLVNW